eukprot:CAMPEP_0115851750 /NCGR_PEP_ID=MMETSP0287-20121206/12641_1 /TAXON_ID=412157 /ORGANISM="Chrysochromulina rotalis, Strain UIO044" /LENGTH=519 /DNA_ID=CAMNT_0003305789 /DNA_START=33 /DNA_END=1592 /DNA_ORIENTATION=+
MRIAPPRPVNLVFEPPSRAVSRRYVIVGTKEALLCDATKDLLPLGLPVPRWEYLVSLAEAGSSIEGATSQWMFTAADGSPSTILAAVLPDACSRHASPVRPHAVTSLVKGSTKPTDLLVVLDDAAYAGGTACAIGRAYPIFSAKTRRAGSADEDDDEPPTVRIGFATRDGPLRNDYVPYAAAAAGVRRAARLVDLPPDKLTTTAFVGEAKAAMERLTSQGRKVECEVISGEALRDGGYGGLWGVGKGAEEPPALVVLSHAPPDAKETVCLVGKSIVYDTGGLSLKTKDGMPGMKSDCGGGAATLAAFEAAVEIGLPEGMALHLVLCIAENAIGPSALRNDDIITCLSGLTCEINNSDAEGRLVLADGVAHATAVPARLPGLEGQPDRVIDMATLTGAQLIATGKRHAAIVSNDERAEAAAVAAGRLSGDMVHPLPFAPEFHFPEFKSQVADMKNSVKDRSNAQSSCAATFIHEHLHPEYKGSWVHVDLAGPAWIEDRGTGFGVGLALGMLQVDGFTSVS